MPDRGREPPTVRLEHIVEQRRGEAREEEARQRHEVAGTQQSEDEGRRERGQRRSRAGRELIDFAMSHARSAVALSNRAQEQGGLDFMVNQYARSAGHMSLVQGLAKKYSGPLGRELDPINQIVVTDGACQ
jgi:aspartate/methionine/tyrosine aminotransferase